MRAPEFWIGNDTRARLFAAFLSPLAMLYEIGAEISRARAQPFRPQARVLCVGNLTVGGSGKTPIAIALARMIIDRGLDPVLLTRGYGGAMAGPVRVDPQLHTASDIGDESLLLTQVAPTVVACNRAAGAALADTMRADIIVMDDGFQNFSVTKDLSVIVVDATIGFGNGHLIPAGPLREKIAGGLKRADALVLVGDGTPDLPPFDKPVLRAHLIPHSATALRGQDIFAFAGIGRPKKFFDSLRAMDAILVQEKAFSDHHSFSRAELLALRRAASARNAKLVTTEKDYVRIPPDLRDGIIPVPIAAKFEDAASVSRLLDKIAAVRD